MEVYEHNGVDVLAARGDQVLRRAVAALGRVDEFTKAARRNVAALAAEVRAGRDVIVAQPTCAYVVKRDYPIYVEGPEADLVAAHTFDPAEYLMRRHRDADDPFTLRDEFPVARTASVPGHGDLPRGLPPAGAERRAAQPGPPQGGRASSARWCSAARASTGPGATGPRTTSWPARWRGRWAARSRRPATRPCAATATWPTGRSCRRRAPSRCTPCS